MTNFLLGFCFGVFIAATTIYFSLPPNEKTISTIAIPGISCSTTTSSQTFTVPPNVKTITITAGPMTGGGGPVTDETPAQIPDDRP